MKKKVIILFTTLINLFFTPCHAQHQNEKSYTDFVIKGEKLYALTSSGHINTFDINTGTAIDTNIHTDTSIAAINIDRKGNIIVITNNKKVEKLNERKSIFENLFLSPNLTFNIVFDTNNNGYLITEKGITDIVTKKNYLPDTTVRLNHQVRGWPKPSAIFMDKDDNIWLGYGFGEWGGELFVFDTKAEKFIKPVLNGFEIELYPVKSIFSDGNAVFISFGLQHMQTSGCIMKFTNYKCSPVFVSESRWVEDIDTSRGKRLQGGEYIGPATYCKKDTSIYFYSQNGLFKGNASKDLSQINNWSKIATPRLHWKYGQPNSVGSPMNVFKMNFADNGKLFLVTQNDGIGVYDGKTFSLLN